MRECKDTRLLVIDDLGAERPTPWTAERLDIIVDHRYVHSRPLIVTSNVPTPRLAARLSGELDDAPGGDGKTGIRIVSRLAEMCDVVTHDRAGPPDGGVLMPWVTEAVRFEEVRRAGRKTVPCARCGAKIRRQRTFTMTASPWNKNPDGTVRTRAEIWAALGEKIAQWQQEPASHDISCTEGNPQ